MPTISEKDFKRYCKEQSELRGISGMPKRARKAAISEMYRTAKDVFKRYETSNFDLKKTLEYYGFADDGTVIDDEMRILYGVVLLKSARVKING